MPVSHRCMLGAGNFIYLFRNCTPGIVASSTPDLDDESWDFDELYMRFLDFELGSQRVGYGK